MQNSKVKPAAWIFDFDNTLFESGREIFPLINERMTNYIEQNLCVDRDEANRLRKKYWDQYGATMTGLVRHHGVDAEHFLKVTHDIGDLSGFTYRSSRLRHLLRGISGKKIIFSNSPAAYLKEMLKLLGIGRYMTDAFSIESTDMNPKPSVIGFRKLLKVHRLNASRCVMVEDSLVNLITAKRLGMKTVWVTRNSKRLDWLDARVSQLY
ncbi:pyrimidine 5'-nucleotidase [Burkholderiales bacterium]|nr:pyrimidine 5'-nucleotidase [Burkholderiales bacterium]